MTIGELLDALAVELAGAGIPPARALARDLIAGMLDQPRFWPTAHRDDVLDPPVVDRIREAARRLGAGMPMQYAVGRAAFRHLSLAVDRRVLIPRPETELLVDLVLAAQRGGRGTVVDVGTGSGAIALALAAEGEFDRVIATDRSGDALAVARDNLRAIPVDRRDRVEFREGSLLEPLVPFAAAAAPHATPTFRVDTIVSNPPYISPDEATEMPRLVLDWEPHEALFAADGGMETIRALVPQAAQVLNPGGLLALEVDSRRATLSVETVSNDGRFTDVELRLDLTGRARFVMARRKEP